MSNIYSAYKAASTSGPVPFRSELESAWEALSQSGWLAGRSPDVRDRLRSVATLRSYDAGEYLISSGDVAQGVFGLASGEVDLSVPRLDGEEYLVHRAESGFWVGEAATFTSESRLISMRARTSCQVVFMPRENLIRLVDAHPKILMDFYQLAQQQLSTATLIIGILSVPGGERRVALRLLVHAEALPDKHEWIYITQSALGELTALSEQSVRRALKRLESDNLVEAGYNKVRIVDHHGLANFCGYSTPAGTLSEVKV